MRLYTLCLTTCLSACFALLTACDDDSDPAAPAEGAYALSVYGEAFIEEGIPAEAFADGWSVTFDTFLIALPMVEVSAGGASPHRLAGEALFDLTEGSGGAGHLIDTLTVPQGAYDHLDYTVGPLTGTPAHSNASAAQIEQMLEGGYALWVSGAATDGADTFTFAWGFTGARTYTGCEIDAAVGEAPGASQLTIHADHLFYDDLESEAPNVAFALIASADANEDGEITLEELAAVDITGEARYQVGSRDIEDLRAFIEAQVGTVGHIDGEGHCD